MGALPKKKLSSSRRGKRYSTKKIELKALVKCKNCGKLKISHVVCPHCGMYRNRQIFEQKEEVKVTKVNEDK